MNSCRVRRGSSGLVTVLLSYNRDHADEQRTHAPETSRSGSRGRGNRFWTQRTGIVNGPAQANLNLSLSKNIPLRWLREGSNLQFRVEFFNIFNHPQFADPDNNFSSTTFGAISSTSVNPRVGQLALKFSF